MTDDHQCAQIRQELGVYLLGTIEPARREVVARHLAACQECRVELAGLAGLPALLRRVPADELRRLLEGDVITAVPGPPLSALLGRMARVRRRRRYLAVAAALIIGVAAVSGWQARRPAALWARGPGALMLRDCR
jgi:anti-sigma factor RsiW